VENTDESGPNPKIPAKNQSEIPLSPAQIRTSRGQYAPDSERNWPKKVLGVPLV